MRHTFLQFIFFRILNNNIFSFLFFLSKTVEYLDQHWSHVILIINKPCDYFLNFFKKKCHFLTIIFKSKLQLTHLWVSRNLSYLLMIWNLTLYPPKIWPKFKLPTYGLKSHDKSVPLDPFLSCIFMVFVFLEEKDIKMEQNYIFSYVFNRDILRNSNWSNLRWIKCQILNHR